MIICGDGMLTHGSLFAGIGGFDLGFETAKIETLWAVENDKSCNTILEKHWPNLKRYGDVKDVGKRNLEPVDIISGGFPCQDLSVAGGRAGLAGGRSGLWYEFARIIEEMEPEWVVVENVPGLFSSNGGEDFAVIVGTLELFGYCVAWRVLDSQYFGVPQRRRRVFIIGSLGGTGSVEVLFESEGGKGHTAEGKEAWQRIAAPVKASSPSSRRGGSNPIAEEFVIDSLTFSDKAACLYSAYGTKWNGNRAAETGELFALTPWDAQRMRIHPEEGIAPTLSQSDGKGGQRCPVVFQQNQRDEVREMDVAGTIAAEPGVHQQNYVAFDWQSGGDVWLNVSDKRITALSRGQTPAIARTLSSTDPSEGGPGDRLPMTGDAMGVRRLTPTECERLQGFPDGWTEGLSDSARYRCLGNAVTVNVAEWIGKRIVENGNTEEVAR